MQRHVNFNRYIEGATPILTFVLKRIDEANKLLSQGFFDFKISLVPPPAMRKIPHCVDIFYKYLDAFTDISIEMSHMDFLYLDGMSNTFKDRYSLEDFMKMEMNFFRDGFITDIYLNQINNSEIFQGWKIEVKNSPYLWLKLTKEIRNSGICFKICPNRFYGTDLNYSLGNQNTMFPDLFPYGRIYGNFYKIQPKPENTKYFQIYIPKTHIVSETTSIENIDELPDALNNMKALLLEQAYESPQGF